MIPETSGLACIAWSPGVAGWMLAQSLQTWTPCAGKRKTSIYMYDV
jgi:hypothetical protein